MKVIFVCDSYIPQNCGMTSVVTYLAEGLAGLGYDVTVIANNPNRNLPKTEVISSVNVVRFCVTRSRWYHIRGDVQEFVSFVQNAKSDAIIFEAIASPLCDVLISHVDNMHGTKILHSHGNPAMTIRPFVVENGVHYFLANLKSYIILRWRNKTIYPRFISKQDAVVTLSDCCSDYQIVNDNAKQKYIIGNAVADMFFEENIPSFDLHTKYSKYIVSIAGFYELKNQKLIVESYLKLTTSEVSLVLIGNEQNSYYEAVRHAAEVGVKKNPTKDIVMLTGVDRTYFPYILRNACLYVVASRKEEFSISLAEAMASGLPFVSTNVGNAREFPGGLIIKSDREMTFAIDSIMTDAAKLQAMALANKIYAKENFCIASAVQKFENLLTLQK